MIRTNAMRRGYQVEKSRAVRVPIIVGLLHLCLSVAAWAEPTSVNVRAYFAKSPDKRGLIEQDAVLVLDDTARRLTVRSKGRPLDVSFDDIERVLFESSSRRRGGGAWGAFGLVGAAIQSQKINDYWCVLVIRAAQGNTTYLLEVPKDASNGLIDKAKSLLGPKVLLPTFPEPTPMKIEDLKARDSKHDLKIDSTTLPSLELPAGKALVVVLNPRWSGNGLQTKLHANDNVVAVTRAGAYAFAYLDPGDYVFASQQGRNVSGVSTRLEAGQEYYFMLSLGNMLSGHTKELVTLLMQDALSARWQRK